MIKLEYIKTTTYACDGGFFVDLIENRRGKLHEAYIYHKDYGVKSLMFGCPVSETKHYQFFAMVLANLEEYKQDYIEEYMI